MKSRTALSIVLALFLNSGAMAEAEVASTNVQVETATNGQLGLSDKTLNNYAKQELDLMAQQQQINDRWAKYIKDKEAHLKELEEAAEHEITEKFTLKKKLGGMVDQFQSEDAFKEIWGDFSTYTKTVP